MRAGRNALSRRSLLGGLGATGLMTLSSPGRAQSGAGLPQRVVVLAGHACAHIGVLGIRPIAVNLGGYTNGLRTAIYGEDWRPEAVGNADYSVDAERVTALRPDLIICSTDEEFALFEGVAPCVAIRDFNTLAQMRADLRSRAAQWNVTHDVEPRIAGFDAGLSAWSSRIDRKPSLVVISTSDHRRINFLRQDNCVIDALRAVSAPFMPIESTSLRWMEGSVETLLEHDPDAVMVLTFAARPEEASDQLRQANPLWRHLRAAREGRIVPIRGQSALHLHGLPTIAQLVDLVATRLHPGLVPAAPGDLQATTPRGR